MCAPRRSGVPRNGLAGGHGSPASPGAARAAGNRGRAGAASGRPAERGERRPDRRLCPPLRSRAAHDDL
ncbi:hypothetical protein QU38_02270 [Staphylococcus aureus]|uniref:Uncharacterized protein n=1 Tax=Staphylococcus aureus TaxID=1280 RepID=A0AA40JQK7_STAAU|nr:hypothetical protein QU38_02270 [Staphylococcus aureus]